MYYPCLLQVAIKYIRKSKIHDEHDLNRIRREIQIMSTLRHPHIINVNEGKEKLACAIYFLSVQWLWWWLWCYPLIVMMMLIVVMIGDDDGGGGGNDEDDDGGDDCYWWWWSYWWW